MNKTPTIRYAAVCLLATGVMVSASSALAQRLGGTFAFTTQTHCVSSFDGFDEETFRPEGDASHRVITAEGIGIYDSDGIGVVDFTTFRTRMDQTTLGSNPVTTSEVSCPSVERTRLPNGTIRTDYGICEGTVILGEIPGLYFKLHGIVSFSIEDLSGKSAIIVNTTPTIEKTVTGTGTTVYSVCARSGSAVRR